MTPKSAIAESLAPSTEAHTLPNADVRGVWSTEPRRRASKGANRRQHRRLTAREFEWLRSARLKYGPEVRVLDISAGGMSIETDHALTPQSHIVIELTGTKSGLVVPTLVLRSQTVQLGGVVRYRSACSFKRPLQLSRLIPRVDRLNDDGPDFIRLDLALKNLLARYLELTRGGEGGGSPVRIDADEIIVALENLVVRAAALRTDPSAHLLADVVAAILPALKARETAAAVLQRIQSELRRTVPQLGVGLSDAPMAAQNPDAESIYFDIAGAPTGARVLNVEYPEGFIPDETQLRVLQGGSYLMKLLQGWNEVLDHSPSQDDAASREPLPPPAAHPASWQKVIARFLDGRVVKGYTNDFSTARPRLHLAETPARSPVLVQLNDLKALFFVRDFEGNRQRVEQKGFSAVTQGRRIEVTFPDGEILIGSTLSYHVDSQGFFVHPADSGSNNLRVYVSNASVRRVRFL